MIKAILAAAGLALVVAPATAQKYDSTGSLLVAPPQAAGPLAPALATATIPAKAALTIAGCTVGTASATCLAANLASAHLQIQNVTSGSTNFVACTFGGSAALNSSGSFMLAPVGGGPSAANWGSATGVVPTGALNCVATAAGAQLYVEYN